MTTAISTRGHDLRELVGDARDHRRLDSEGWLPRRLPRRASEGPGGMGRVAHGYFVSAATSAARSAVFFSTPLRPSGARTHDARARPARSATTWETFFASSLTNGWSTRRPRRTTCSPSLDHLLDDVRRLAAPPLGRAISAPPRAPSRHGFAVRRGAPGPPPASRDPSPAPRRIRRLETTTFLSPVWA